MLQETFKHTQSTFQEPLQTNTSSPKIKLDCNLLERHSLLKKMLTGREHLYPTFYPETQGDFLILQ